MGLFGHPAFFGIVAGDLLKFVGFVVTLGGLCEFFHSSTALHSEVLAELWKVRRMRMPFAPMYRR